MSNTPMDPVSGAGADETRPSSPVRLDNSGDMPLGAGDQNPMTVEERGAAMHANDAAAHAGEQARNEAQSREGLDTGQFRAGPSVPVPVYQAGGADVGVFDRQDNTDSGTGFLDPAQEAIFRAMANMLQSMGLGSLFSFIGGKPGGWLWETIVEKDYSTEDELMIALEDRPEFRERFSVMFAQRERAGRGEPVQIMTPAEIRAYEQQAAAMMRAANIPAEFYDSYKDMSKLIERGISISQLNQRINESYDRVYNSPIELRTVFGEYYGVSGDAVLASFFLDPGYTEANLDRMSRAAAVGGISRSMGYELTANKAEQLALMGASEQDRQKLASVTDLNPLYAETISERTDYTAGEEGVNAAFDVDGTSKTKLATRARTRVADFSGGGGPARERSGYGVGTAE
jgi:hypothetical protein